MKHIRIIVTEQDDQVSVSHVVLSHCEQTAVRRTRELLRSLIEGVARDHPEAAPRPDRLEAAVQCGYWFAELDIGDFSVLVFEPERIEGLDPTWVEVDVEDGRVTAVRAPAGTVTLVRDFDTDGADPARLSRDDDGRSFVAVRWEGGEP